MTNDKITPSLVEKIARLASLTLSSEQISGYVRVLSSVMEIVDQVSQVDTGGVEPTAQVTGMTNVFRADKVDTTRCLTQKEAIGNAAATHQGYFKVKSIFG